MYRVLNKFEILNKKVDKNLINQAFYTLLKKNIEIQNNTIRDLAKSLNLIFLNKFDYVCDYNQKTCDGITNQGKKIFFDYGHYTLDGAKYFGEKIHKIQWINNIF